MKKTIGFILTLILISISTLAYAATPTYDVNITSPKTELNTSEEVKVTVSIKNATGMTNGIYAYLGKLEYDTEVFEKITQESFSGEGTWSAPVYNENNGLIIGDGSSGITSEGNIFTITLKVKETAAGKTGEIKLTDFSASEGDADIKANKDASVTIKVIGQTTDTDDNSSDNIGNNNTNDNQNNNNNNTNGTINNGSNNPTNKPIKDTQKEDTTKSPTPVPQTGETSVIIISIITVILIGAFSYTKYKKYIKL